MKVRDAMAKAVSSARKSDKVIDVARKMKHDVAIGNHANQRATIFEHRDEPGVFLLTTTSSRRRG
jgi:hypothetical protein